MARAPASAGKLRERIRLDGVVQTPDGYGGRMTSWAKFAVVWAGVEPPASGGSEQTEGGQIAPVYTYRFTIHRRVDLKETMRVVWPVDSVSGENVAGSREFNLRSIGLGPSSDLFMVLDAEAGVAI